MEASRQSREYAEDKLEKIRKYFIASSLGAHAVFSVERNHNHTAESRSRSAPGSSIQAARPPRTCTRRSISRWRASSGRCASGRTRSATTSRTATRASRCARACCPAEALEPPPAARQRSARPAEEARAASPARRRPAIKVIKEQTFTVRAMRVEDAVMQMNLLENDFLVFTDIDTKGLSVVYRRKDGNYG
jgi:putative sigma-54 modulation protein